ncbi:hypothetical protein [Nocardioides sp.]|uniref:hypothetical protein n=1 Tax=Nocardioides sp. TaxID=35761 RepID=UPI0019ACEFD2|nr:hypothetical protein [Nocardioides sp.]MBC7274901.1 hypothetical protein [Nocardioides sp.]
MTTGSERYRQHTVWETLRLKQDALAAARYDDAATEQWRKDIVEWLAEATKTRLARQPALYLTALDDLSNALNSLPVDVGQFRQYVANRQNHPQSIGALETALRSLPLPPPKDLGNAYVELLDQEVEARTDRLDELETRVAETEAALAARLDELNQVSAEVERLDREIEAQRRSISDVSSTGEDRITHDWNERLATWIERRRELDEKHNAESLEHVATLAAIRQAAGALAEHAAGDLSATDWSGRATRERSAARWIRFGAIAAFVFAGAVGWFIVNEAIRNDFELTIGDGILRASVAAVIAAFGALLLRESARHFTEADTAEDVSLSLQALAPFYAGSDPAVRVAAREQVGDAVLVKNVLSRFANRDAAKHAAGINAAELPALVRDATKALSQGSRSPGAGMPGAGSQ